MKKLLLSTIYLISALLANAQTPKLTWAKSIGGSLDDEPAAIALDGSGNIYMTGHFTGTVDFDPGSGISNLISKGISDIFISKSDASGNFVWAKSMGGTLADYGNDLYVDASGNVFTTGQFKGTVDFNPGTATSNLTAVGDDDIFILKLDAAGNFVWAKQMGGTLVDYGWSIEVDAAGNIITTGGFSGTSDFDPGATTSNLTSGGLTDIYVSKLDASGNFVWAKNMGGTDYDEGRSLALDATGNVYVTGNFYSTVDFDPGTGTSNLTSAGDADIFISKLNSSGNFVWAKSMGGPKFEGGYSIAVNSTGQVYTTGYFTGTADFDPGASTSNISASGIWETFISKLDASGNFVWAKQLGGPSCDIGGFALKLDVAGNVYVNGVFEGTVDFDPGSGTFNLSSGGSGFAIFISKIDASGNFVWAIKMGGTSGNIENDMTMDAAGNIYIVGSYTLTTDFDPGAGITNLVSAGASDIFVSKLSQTSGNIIENPTNDLIIYPNPTNGIINLELGILNEDDLEIHVLNSIGQIVWKENQIQHLPAGRQGSQFNIQHLPKGLYLLKVINDNKTIASQKMVIE